MKLPRILQGELDKLQGRWAIREGKRHKHILIDGRMIGTLPHDFGGEGDQRGYLNIRAQIRRCIRGKA